MKNTMSLVATCLFIPIRLPNLSFGVCFTCFAIFISLLIYIILLAKQTFVYNQLTIITPPSTAKQCSLGLVGNDFLLRVFPQNEF
jgi:hypothetical protein